MIETLPYILLYIAIGGLSAAGYYRTYGAITTETDRDARAMLTVLTFLLWPVVGLMCVFVWVLMQFGVSDYD